MRLGHGSRLGRAAAVALFALLVTVSGCAGGQALYPARPPASPGVALAELAPSRVVLHATITSAGLKRALDQNIPLSGAGTAKRVGER